MQVPVNGTWNVGSQLIFVIYSGPKRTLRCVRGIEISHVARLLNADAWLAVITHAIRPLRLTVLRSAARGNIRHEGLSKSKLRVVGGRNYKKRTTVGMSFGTETVLDEAVRQ